MSAEIRVSCVQIYLVTWIIFHVISQIKSWKEEEYFDLPWRWRQQFPSKSW